MSDFTLATLLGSGSKNLEPPIMTKIPNPSPHPAQPDTDDSVGYGRPPQHSRFTKGRSGNPAGRPKRPDGISIKEIFDDDQIGKNGEVVSNREAYVTKLMRQALECDSKAFQWFVDLMRRASLLRSEEKNHATVITVPTRTGTMEEFERDFGRSNNETKA